jgi:hypothetical protein
MRPNAEAVVDLMVKVALAVTGFQFSEDFRVLRFAAVFRCVFLGLGDSPARAARGLMTLGDFVPAAFDALFDYGRFDTVLRFSGETVTLDFGRAAVMFVVFRMFRGIFRGFVELILTGFRKNDRSESFGSHCSPISSTLIVMKHKPVFEMRLKKVESKRADIQ